MEELGLSERFPRIMFIRWSLFLLDGHEVREMFGRDDNER